MVKGKDGSNRRNISDDRPIGSCRTALIFEGENTYRDKIDPPLSAGVVGNPKNITILTLSDLMSRKIGYKKDLQKKAGDWDKEKTLTIESERGFP
jgi:hypothetical protein